MLTCVNVKIAAAIFFPSLSLISLQNLSFEITLWAVKIIKKVKNRKKVLFENSVNADT